MDYSAAIAKAIGEAPSLAVLVAVVWLFLRDRTLMKADVDASRKDTLTLLQESLGIVRENTKAISDLREVMAGLTCPYGNQTDTEVHGRGPRQ